jgi:hypothetical protein
MKQLQMTAELQALIRDRVGQDVDPSGFAVFEVIALNTNPLPGKDGSIHEKAVVTPLTLKQMADHINAPGGSLPLIWNHQTSEIPKGRVFSASTFFDQTGAIELRVLFYLDATEQDTITKLNSGSIDEVSVSFLSTQALCSECGWDYMGADSTWEHLYDRTCANGHAIGEDGVHLRLTGLAQFVETSLVVRGAADKPKIIGRSDSKLAPSSVQQLAARGFDLNCLLVQASKGEKPVSTFDPNKFITDLANSQASVITLTAERDTANAAVTALTAERDTANAAVTTLTAERDDLQTKLTAAEGAPPEEYNTALSFLKEQFVNLTVAKGGEKPADDAVPTTVVDLTKAIKDMTAELTALIPTGGRSNANPSDLKTAAPVSLAAFRSTTNNANG